MTAAILNPRAAYTLDQAYGAIRRLVESETRERVLHAPRSWDGCWTGGDRPTGEAPLRWEVLFVVPTDDPTRF
jgi:hypothetical protein